MTPLKSIARVENNRTKGWLVRIWWKGERYSRLFSDGRCGGEELALAEAIAWRDELEEQLGKPNSERRIRGGRGVCRSSRSGREEWIASWPGGSRAFPVKRHGEMEAKRLAIAERQKHV